jgi:hypothetical protein
MVTAPFRMKMKISPLCLVSAIEVEGGPSKDHRYIRLFEHRVGYNLTETEVYSESEWFIAEHEARTGFETGHLRDASWGTCLVFTLLFRWLDASAHNIPCF